MTHGPVSEHSSSPHLVVATEGKLLHLRPNVKCSQVWQPFLHTRAQPGLPEQGSRVLQHIKVLGGAQPCPGGLCW